MKKQKEEGAVSLISVLIFSLIIVIVATAFMTNISRQQREAINYDLKTRASYAAEVGVQDAVRSLNSAAGPIVDKTDCNPGALGNIDPATKLSYTCQLIDVDPGELTGAVDPNKRTATVPVQPNTPDAGPYRLKVSWSIPAKDTTLGFTIKYPRPDSDGGAKTFRTLKDWNLNTEGPGGSNRPIHPAMRVNIISHPVSPPLNRDNIHQSVIIFNPTSSTYVDPTPKVFDDNTKSDQDRSQFVSNASCRISGGSTDSDYSCVGLVDLGTGANPNFNLSTSGGPTADMLYVHVAALYGPSSWKLELGKAAFIPGGLATYKLINSQAVIDVTGKAGNVFHRVKQTLPIQGAELVGSDAALTIGDGICKNFLITADTATYSPRLNVCDPDDPEF